MIDHRPTTDRRVVCEQTSYVTVLQDTAKPTAWVAAAEPVPIRR
jgi:hypothetical protein